VLKLAAVLFIFIIAQPIRAQVLIPGNETHQGVDPVLARCPTLARLIAENRADHLRNPNFSDQKSARAFADECAKIVNELDAAGHLNPHHLAIRHQAALAAEFLKGDCYLLSTSNIKSVVQLRDEVKIAPPPGFIYVRKYPSTDAMPSEVTASWETLDQSTESTVRGVTLQGRYIALLESEYHDELEDNLAHEMVHAYITLACPKALPIWFQEAAAVYFSTGKASKLYGKTGDPNMVKMVIPEEYKRKFYSFKYIEEKVGQEKLFSYVKNAVETGDVDARKVLGIETATQKPRNSSHLWFFIGAGAAAVILTVWLISYFRNSWAE